MQEKINILIELWEDGEVTDSCFLLHFFLYGYFFYHLDNKSKMKQQFFFQQWSHLVEEENFKDEESLAFLIRQYPLTKIKKKVVSLLQVITDLNQRPYKHLKLCSFIPSAIDILTLQANPCYGIRPVSILYQRKNWNAPILHRKNIFDFLLHDLEHLAMFTLDEKSYRHQHRFFQLLLKSYRDNIWAPFLSETVQGDKFKSTFDYVISDMNTHPSHAVATLKAAILEHGITSFITQEKIAELCQYCQFLAEESFIATLPS